jgi:hypothetical protein
MRGGLLAITVGIAVGRIGNANKVADGDTPGLPIGVT